MDLEVIRELINAFQQLGGEAKEVFIWYLIVAYLPTFVVELILSCGGIWLFARVIRVVYPLKRSDELGNKPQCQDKTGDA